MFSFLRKTRLNVALESLGIVIHMLMTDCGYQTGYRERTRKFVFAAQQLPKLNWFNWFLPLRAVF